jgi:hypothetical protein
VTFAGYSRAGGGFIKVQMVLRNYATIGALIDDFDFGSAGVAFDGSSIWVSHHGVIAYKYDLNIVDLARATRTYEQRLVKYAKRGFGLIFLQCSSECYMCLTSGGCSERGHYGLVCATKVDGTRSSYQLILGEPTRKIHIYGCSWPHMRVKCIDLRSIVVGTEAVGNANFGTDGYAAAEFNHSKPTGLLLRNLRACEIGRKRGYSGAQQLGALIRCDVFDPIDVDVCKSDMAINSPQMFVDFARELLLSRNTFTDMLAQLDEVFGVSGRELMANFAQDGWSEGRVRNYAKQSPIVTESLLRFDFNVKTGGRVAPLSKSPDWYGQVLPAAAAATAAATTAATAAASASTTAAAASTTAAAASTTVAEAWETY